VAIDRKRGFASVRLPISETRITREPIPIRKQIELSITIAVMKDRHGMPCGERANHAFGLQPRQQLRLFGTKPRSRSGTASCPTVQPCPLSGQNIGITIVAAAHMRRLSGKPIFMKSKNLYPPAL